MPGSMRIGTAGWSIPTQYAGAFPGEGSHLARYARRLPAVEINSSFYRPHRPQTYARWAASVPADFRFAVKVPREVTHRRRLVDVAVPLGTFLDSARHLGDRLGPLLVQLPPSLRHEPAVATAFLTMLRARFAGDVVCEPRHPSWFTDDVDRMLQRFRVARVAADPAPVPRAAEPGGWPGLVYWRLHGSPEMYHSAYPAQVLAAIARRLHESAARRQSAWCILDNTAEGAATGDALSLLAGPPAGAPRCAA